MQEDGSYLRAEKTEPVRNAQESNIFAVDNSYMGE